ncbi:DNA recombination protein RmuC [Ruixingdingia sedimenti]|uniref:DNA recombination protein RmuC homolog n=1 Tax=Ruixingdingia sedimenti TaxID=3073604 RepID=A0ABU1FFS2_9RHOB|nr:DNA recombination protein RmuC [Xinfangfangia sp. LG-4]MDR5655247.1 DNA recombination protein RmuC [Xinfangfangia sp. LG-4]
MDTDSPQNFLAWLAAQNPVELAMVGVGLLVLVLLLFVLLRMRSTGNAGELARLSTSLADKEARLTEVASRADRAEALVSERKAETDRLSTEVSTLRARIETDQAQMRELGSLISGLQARQQADTALIAERDATITRLTSDIATFQTRIEVEHQRQKELSADVARMTTQTQADAQAIAERRADGQKAAEVIIELRKRVEAEQQAQQVLKARISALETQIEAERVAADDKIALLTKIRDDMQERFRQLADEALKTQGEAFSKANVERLEATLSPLKEHVGHFEKELREVHQETVKDRERLKTEIAQLTRRSEAISQEALALTRALKGDHQQQGAWGEMILENILERSGLRKDEEYLTQAHRTGTEGERLRPDVVVRIPGGKSLVIDSKVSLNDYAAAVNAEDESEAILSRKRHVAAMRAHINGLSAKSYQLAEGQSVDYVIMFVPIEGALSEALREDGKLTEYALERHITIATPTTLMMAMRTVSHVWAVERRNQNAENIAKRAGLLYDKVTSFVTNMEKVGKGIETAQGAYESAIGQLSRGRGNVLSQVEALKSLGARATKSISLEFEGKAEALALSVDLETVDTEPAE